MPEEMTDVKTTVLTNIPIEQEDFPETVLPHELAVYADSDGNLTIQNNEEGVVAEGATVYVTQIGEPIEEMEGEYEEYELYEEETAGEEDEDEDDEEEEHDSKVDDPDYEVGKEPGEVKFYECDACKRSFKTSAVSGFVFFSLRLAGRTIDISHVT